MKAILVQNGTLVWGEAPDVTPSPEEVLVKIAAVGVNRADLHQAKGNYPPPAGASDILGLELAGVVQGTGERVCALVPGGAYAEYAAVDRSVLVPIPEQWTFAQAAAFPEAWFTAFVNLFLEGGLAPGESVLIHAGASSVGTAAIQLARTAGATVFVTAGSDEKLERCRDLGANHAINYKTEDFAAEVMQATGKEGVDVILDCIGGSYLAQNITALKRFGRLVNIGVLGGAKAELNLGQVLTKRLRIIGSTLRSRSRAEHASIARQFRDRFWPKIESGELRVVLDRIFPIPEAQQAHDYVAQNRNIGKVVLSC